MTDEIKTAPDGLRYHDGGPGTDDHLAGGGHEQPLAPVLRNYLRKGQAFWNVGAHVGGWALRVAQLPEVGDVVAFEANPRTAGRLADNAFANGIGTARLEIVQNAVSDTAGQVVRLVDANGKNTGGSTRVDNTPTRTTDGEIIAETITLDDWWDEQFDEHRVAGDPFYPELIDGALRPAHVFNPPGLLLIDVEGHEVAVLRGARHLIEAHHPNLIIEVHEGHPGVSETLVADLEAILRELGYSWSPGKFYGDEVHWICGWSAFLDDEPDAVDVEFAPEGTPEDLSPFDVLSGKYVESEQAAAGAAREESG